MGLRRLDEHFSGVAPLVRHHGAIAFVPVSHFRNPIRVRDAEMIRSAEDDCPEFDAAAFAREAERIAALGRHALPNEVGHHHIYVLP